MSTLSTPALSNLPVDASAQPKPKRIHEAAQQFESLLIGEMLKSARSASSDGWLGSGESTGDDSAMDMAESQLANALASSGGLGLASTIERVMNKTTSQKTADTAAENPDSSSLKKP
ncbi:MAG: rod-binding protein [Acidobacteriota bacterium]|nr:rod-binding protein [Acidobacteriota bacterium]